MTEHEQLKQICDKIGYEYYKYKYEIPYNLDIDKVKIDKDVREIIFTKEFMDLLEKYYKENINDCSDKTFPGILRMSNDFLGILKNLDNPVQYLYNLLELGK